VEERAESLWHGAGGWDDGEKGEDEKMRKKEKGGN